MPTNTPTEQPKVENGLGLQEFLKPILEGIPPSDKPVETTPEVFPEEKPEVKPEETPKEEEKKPEAIPAKDAVKEPAQKEKPKDDEKPDVMKLQKQLKDTRDYATRVNQENVETKRSLDRLAAQMTVLQQKLDGTYEEAKAEKPEVIADRARMEAKVATSHHAAVEVYGEEAVNKMVWDKDAPYRQFDADPAIQARVANAKLPVLEAIKVVKEAELREKYGKDPEAMRAAIEKEVTEKLTKEITEKVEKEFKKKPPVKVEPLAGLSGVTGADRLDQKASDDQPIKLESLFPNFTPSAGS